MIANHIFMIPTYCFTLHNKALHNLRAGRGVGQGLQNNAPGHHGAVLVRMENTVPTTTTRARKRAGRITLATALAALVVLPLASCATTGAAEGAEQKTYTVKVGTTAEEFNGGQIAYGTAVVNGYFEEEGITLEPVLTGSAPDTLKALAVGQIDVGFLSLSTTNQAIEQGQPVILAAAVASKNGWTPIVSVKWLEEQGIDPAEFSGWPVERQAEALIGTTWATNSAGGYVERASWLLAKDYLGLDPDRDVKLTAIDTQVKIAGIKDGTVQVWLAALPDNRLLVESGDAIELLTSDELVEALPEVGYTTGAETIINTDWAEENEEAAKAFFRAYQKGADFASSHTVEEILDAAKQSYPDLDEARLRQTVANAKEHLPADSRHTPEEVEYQIQFALKSGNISAPLTIDQVYTEKYLPPVD